MTLVPSHKRTGTRVSSSHDLTTKPRSIIAGSRSSHRLWHPGLVADPQTSIRFSILFCPPAPRAFRCWMEYHVSFSRFFPHAWQVARSRVYTAALTCDGIAPASLPCTERVYLPSRSRAARYCSGEERRLPDTTARSSTTGGRNLRAVLVRAARQAGQSRDPGCSASHATQHGCAGPSPSDSHDGCPHTRQSPSGGCTGSEPALAVRENERVPCFGVEVAVELRCARIVRVQLDNNLQRPGVTGRRRRKHRVSDSGTSQSQSPHSGEWQQYRKK